MSVDLRGEENEDINFQLYFPGGLFFPVYCHQLAGRFLCNNHKATSSTIEIQR